jgi:ankyrin repeat protein
LEALLACGAIPSQCDEQGRSALLLAAMRGRKECVEMLLAAGAWEEVQEQGAKEEVCQWLKHFKLMVPDADLGDSAGKLTSPSALALSLCLIHEPEKPVRSFSPARIEERWAKTPHGRLAWLLKPVSQEDVHGGQGPLECAIVGYGIKEVARIISLGAPLIAEYSLDADGKDVGTALDLALLSRRFSLAQQLLSGLEGSSLAQLSTRAVVWSARDGRLELVRELLRLGAPAGQCDEAGRSALLMAATRGHTECASALLQANAWQCEGAREDVLDWATKWKMACFSGCE